MADTLKIALAQINTTHVGALTANADRIRAARAEGARPGEYQVQVAFDRKAPGAG